MDRRGTTAIITALGMLTLVGFAGLAVDTARAWLVEDRLKTAMDAAALVAARHMSDPNRDAIATEVFWAQFSQGGGGHGYLGATVNLLPPSPVDNDPSKIQIKATASIPTTLFGVISKQAVSFSDSTVAQRTGTGLEVALVLDNTGSMATNNAIGALITASQQLIGILYGNADTRPNLWVSIVPFASTVNIDKTHTSWLVPGSLDQSKYHPSAWMGCVMARTAQTGAQNGDDFNDKTPAQAPLEPFLYSTTWHQYPYAAQDKNGNPVTKYYTGDNDWVEDNWTKNGNSGVQGDGVSGKTNEPDGDNGAVGPNLGCPSLAILPETASKSTVSQWLGQMIPIYRGGTFINLGLQAGWWTISPNWQGLWGTPADPKLGALPLAYNTPHMKKAIVLMTDGNNNWNDWDGGVPGAGPSPWVNDGDTDFTAYGRLKSNKLGMKNVAQSTITSTLNGWMDQMCTAIKSNGIVIYTILFNNNDKNTAKLFQSCASSSNNYFNAPTQAQLQAAFQQIGSQLASLRLAQ